jgi:AcrR family transcriptional regulator
MSKTKEKILEAAKDLFNEVGYKDVTIRMIALKLEMSSGTLNFHFQKREVLLEALYYQMVENFDERIDHVALTDISFKQILKDIQSSMERMLHYKFIWTNLYSLLRDNEKIFAHFSNVYKERIRGNLFLFDQLNKMGLMRAPSFKNEYQMLSERMINFGDTWIYSSEVYRKNNTGEDVVAQSHSMLAILYPYLTEEGVQEYEKVVSE